MESIGGGGWVRMIGEYSKRFTEAMTDTNYILLSLSLSLSLSLVPICSPFSLMYMCLKQHTRVSYTELAAALVLSNPCNLLERRGKELELSWWPLYYLQF